MECVLFLGFATSTLMETEIDEKVGEGSEYGHNINLMNIIDIMSEINIIIRIIFL